MPVRIAGIFVAIMLMQPVGQAAQAGNGIPSADLFTLALGRIPPDVFEAGTSSRTPPVAKNATVRNCRVTSVHDGDSMRVRCPGFSDTLRIRLDQIDAPELDQVYGTRSRDVLRSMCPKNGQAVVHDLGEDSYNRRLGRVFCNDVDVNAAMVEKGAAWVYDYHAADKSLYRLQEKAQSRKKGLWAGPGDPVAPWDFRNQQRRQDRR